MHKTSEMYLVRIKQMKRLIFFTCETSFTLNRVKTQMNFLHVEITFLNLKNLKKAFADWTLSWKR